MPRKLREFPEEQKVLFGGGGGGCNLGCPHRAHCDCTGAPGGPAAALHAGFLTGRQTGRQESKGEGLWVVYHSTWGAQLSAWPSVCTSHFTLSRTPPHPNAPRTSDSPGARADVPTALKGEIGDFNAVSCDLTSKFPVSSVV